MGQYKGVYESMKFPEYRFKEFPKKVVLKDGRKVIVNSQSEELGLLTEVKQVENVEKLKNDKENVEKLLMESRGRLAELEKELAARDAGREIKSVGGNPKPTLAK